MLKQMAVALVVGAAIIMPAASGAGEVSDLAAQAERRVKDDPLAALQAIDGAFDKLWAQLPLVVTQATFVAKPPKGFGLYKPRSNSTFKPGEPLIVYAEVAGFGYKPVDGAYEIAINGDVAIATMQKQVLAKMPDFLKSRMRSHRRNKEFMVQMTIELSGAPTGQYVLLARLKDMVSGKTTSFSLPFEIAR